MYNKCLFQIHIFLVPLMFVPTIRLQCIQLHTALSKFHFICKFLRLFGCKYINKNEYSRYVF